jgi:2-oxoglutarate dehydrogenase E1 component
MQLNDLTFLSGPNAAFIAELYARYVEDPATVDAEWQRFFADLHDEGHAVLDELRGASWAPRQAGVIGNGATNGAGVAEARRANGLAATAADSGVDVRAAARDSVRALMLIRAYRVRGHLECNLDPLRLKRVERHP